LVDTEIIKSSSINSEVLYINKESMIYLIFINMADVSEKAEKSGK